MKIMNSNTINYEKKSMISEVYDIETLVNLFTYTGYCRQTKTYHQFIIHKLRNDYEQLIQHLKRDKLIMIGYNNESFDYVVIHHMIKSL
jgi:effector-binding domain-containing protein